MERKQFLNRQSSTEYSGLTSVPGIVSVTCPSQPDVCCPFCANTGLALLMGKVIFSATISGDDLFDGSPQPLLAVVCSKSHVFFLRETDALPKPSQVAA
jgi:hypothetical protein